MRTPLHEAAEKGDLAAVKTLLQKGQKGWFSYKCGVGAVSSIIIYHFLQYINRQREIFI